MARLKCDMIVWKQRFEDCQLLGSSCSHYRANPSCYIGTDFQPRLVKEQGYSGVLFSHAALYLYSNPDPLLNLIFCECCLMWFWSFSSWWHSYCQSWCPDYHSHAHDARHCQRELSFLQRPEAYAKLSNWKLNAVSKGCFHLLLWILVYQAIL